jgi:hypothetical protein
MGTCPKCGKWNRGDKLDKSLCPSCSRAKNDEEKLTQLRIKETKKNLRNNDSGGGSRFHGLYCLLVGWWLAMIIACCVVPLFFPGGRRLIKKAFGIW